MSIVLKTLNTLEPHELFMINNHFSIYVEPHGNHGHMLANLRNSRLDIISLFHTPQVVSYGKKWFLNVKNFTFTNEDQAGGYIGENGPLIRVSDSQDLLCIDAATAHDASTPPKLAKAGSWRIWTSPNGSPTVIFDSAST